MATLIINVLWINLVSTGDGISAPSVGPEFESGLNGEVRTYAGGRQRYVGVEGVAGQLERTLRLLTIDEVETLESWCGQTVLVRDYRGQHWWGVYSKIRRHAIKGSDKYDITFTLNIVTQDEGV